jgi:hypothetical protein
MAGLRLPDDRHRVAELKQWSKVACWVALVFSGLAILKWIPGPGVAPILILAVVFSVASLLVEVKPVSLVCSWAVLAIGIFQLVTFGMGFGFAPIGLALVLPHTKVDHRFHYVHFLAYLSLVMNCAAILGFAYQWLSPLKFQLVYVPPDIAAISVFLSMAALFKWPARGLVGVFTSDSVSSMYALRLLFINVIVILLTGLVTLAGAKVGMYSPGEAVMMFAVALVVISTTLAWVNVRLLYRFELERLVMKEELRVHNISLKLGNEELTNNVTRLKETNEEYAGKLSHRDKYGDIIGSLE